MIHLFESSGSTEIQLLDESIPAPKWTRLKAVAARLLERKGNPIAAQRLRHHPFLLYSGTNWFGDEFQVLYMKVALSAYVEFGTLSENPAARRDFKAIAEAVTEIAGHVRFVAVDLDTDDGPEPVAPPVLEITSDVVDRALRDAERLIATEGATSGVDRVHTAFHGYLLALAGRAGLVLPANPSVTQLFRALRDGHPSFREIRPRQGDIDKMIRAMASIVDAANPVRNLASVAHPNESLLEQAEAMLVINCLKSLLHYLNARTRS